MELISQIKKIENKISGKIFFDQSLSKYSWFNLGGAAKVIFIPKNLNELSNFLVNSSYLDSGGFKSLGSNSIALEAITL